MAYRGARWSDRWVAIVVGYFLRTGVIVSAACVFAGGVFYLMKYGAGLPDYKVFTGEPADLRGLHGIWKDVLSLHSRGMIQFGLLLLMLMPGAWISFLFFSFVMQKDRTYIIASAIVLGALIFSFAGGYL